MNRIALIVAFLVPLPAYSLDLSLVCTGVQETSSIIEGLPIESMRVEPLRERQVNTYVFQQGKLSQRASDGFVMRAEEFIDCMISETHIRCNPELPPRNEKYIDIPQTISFSLTVNRISGRVNRKVRSISGTGGWTTISTQEFEGQCEKSSQRF